MTIRNLLLLCLAPLCPLAASAQTVVAYPLTFSTPWQLTTGFVSASATPITVIDSYVDFIHLANISSSTVTVTITDASTNCSSGACQWWPTITIAPNSVYVQAMNGIYSPKGVTLTASVASAVVGWIRGKYATSNGP